MQLMYYVYMRQADNKEGTSKSDALWNDRTFGSNGSNAIIIKRKNLRSEQTDNVGTSRSVHYIIRVSPMSSTSLSKRKIIERVQMKFTLQIKALFRHLQ